MDSLIAWYDATRRQPGLTANFGAYPRCPFAAVGLKRCLGYQPRAIPPSSSLYLPQPIPGYLTCQHLLTAPTRHGFIPACSHPLGMAANWWEQYQRAEAPQHAGRDPEDARMDLVTNRAGHVRR